MREMFTGDIVEYITDRIETDCDSITVVGSYDTIVDIFNKLIKYEDTQFVFGELYSPDVDGYDDAYYIEYDGFNIYLSKARIDSSDYLMVECDLALVEEDYYEKFVETNKDIKIVRFGYANQNINTGDEDQSCICVDDDGYGFTFCDNSNGGHTKFKYRSSCILTDDDIHRILHEYEFI